MANKVKNMNRKKMINISMIALAFTVFTYGVYLFWYKPADSDVLSAVTSNTATFSFDPGALTLPLDGTTQLKVSVGSEKISFVHAEITFDKDKVKLAENISISGSPLTRVIKVTSASDANSSGKIQVILALDPEKASNPPTGNVTLATLKWATNTSTSNVTSSVKFSTSSLKAYNTKAELFTIKSSDISLSLNPASSTTPSTTEPSSGTGTGTGTTTKDTTPPTVSITAPSNGSSIARVGTVEIKANASDGDSGTGIARVEFYVNKWLMYSDTSSPYSYSWRVFSRRGVPYTITAKAYDKAGNSASSSVTVKTK